MVSLDNEQFDKLCRLAKLRIGEQEKAHFMDKMCSVFSWINQLDQIDTEGITLDERADMITTREREDLATKHNTCRDILLNAKCKKFDMFCVPKIVE